MSEFEVEIKLKNCEGIDEDKIINHIGDAVADKIVEHKVKEMSTGDNEMLKDVPLGKIMNDYGMLRTQAAMQNGESQKAFEAHLKATRLAVASGSLLGTYGHQYIPEQEELIRIEQQQKLAEKKRRQSKNRLSFIEPHEEEEAKELIKNLLGFNPEDEIRAIGFWMLVKIYYPEEYLTTKSMDKEESRIITTDNIKNLPQESRLKSLERQLNQIKKSGIILPESALAFEKFRSCTALVVGMGPAAYEGERFEDWDNGFPKVGDWVVIPKNEGSRIIVSVDGKDFDMLLISEDKVRAIVKDPSNVKIQM